MKEIFALILTVVIFASVITAMHTRVLPSPPSPQALQSDASNAVTGGYEPPVLPIALNIENGRLYVATDIKLKTEIGTFGVHISPRQIRWLYVKLGAQTRAYEINHAVKIFIPNSLTGKSTFEWGDDYALVTIEQPENLRFPDQP